LVGEAAATTGDARGLVGRSKSDQGKGIFAAATSDTGDTTGLHVKNFSKSGTGAFIENISDVSDAVTTGIRSKVESPGDNTKAIEGWASANSGTTYGVYGTVSSPDGFGLYTPDDAKIEGDLHVEGTKHFVQAVETSTGPKEVMYNAVEAGKAHTELSDTAELTDGRAEINFPDHFSMVTSDEESLCIQVTPYAKEKVQPQVVKQSTDRFVVKDFSDESLDYTFAYTVKGVREGYEDQEVVRDKE
jgi:hypothetical protein